MFPDVVVIGGGIVGCSCAYYLSRAGAKVHLVEKGPMGSGASKAGMCHVVTWEEPEIHLRLARASKQLYEALSEELPADIEYRRTGSMAIVEKPEALESFGEIVRSLQDWGLNCRLLSAEEIAEMEPIVAPDIGGGMLFPEDAQVNPLYATLGLARGAEDHGATIQSFAEVTGIELSADGRKVVAVNTTADRIPTKCVVNAAGAWSGVIGNMVGLDVPVTPRKGHLVVTVPVPDNVVNCKIILAAGYMDSLKESVDVAVAANLQQTANGNLLLGTSRQFVGFDRSVEPQVISLMLSRCLRFFPTLSEVHAIRTWAGLRPYTPDLLPIIGPVDTLEGFYMASGHEGIGITEGPITGKLISQIVTGQEPDLPLEELSLSRFAREDKNQ
jgi:glycine/D-amino acid oxidase-like deaminating enzyme